MAAMLRSIPRVERIAVASARLPGALDGTTVAAISDLHAGMRRGGPAGVRGVVDTVNSLQPDIIVLLGDIVHRPKHATEYLPLLADLHARIGVWATLGNHEHAFDWRSRYVPPRSGISVERWRELYAELGIELLYNEARPLGETGARIWIVGIGDAYSGHNDVAAALAPVENGEFRLGITHSPDLLDDPHVGALDLVLAGHTHGGQIRLPLVGALYAPVRRPRQRGAGMVEASGTRMYIGRGVGEAIPIRLNCPREIPFITLTAEDDAMQPQT